MNVREYFESKFPDHAYADPRDPTDLASMPLESNCGDDCKKAIDAAWAFLECSRMAHGNDEILDATIGLATVAIVATFICG